MWDYKNEMSAWSKVLNVSTSTLEDYVRFCAVEHKNTEEETIKEYWPVYRDVVIKSLFEYGVENCKRSNRSYDGTEQKFGIVKGYTNYLIKMQKKDWNNVVCEYVASNVINILGGKAHETQLGNYNGKLVVLCKDFTDEIGDIKTLGALNESSIDTDISNHEYYFEDIVYQLGKLLKSDTSFILKEFMEMYVYDTLLGNPDRHARNWGIYRKYNEWHLTPIYDNGASLLPRANYSNITDEDWLKERIYTFPNSKIMFNKCRERLSYYSIWQTDAITNTIKTFARALPIEDAIAWISTNPLLSKEQRTFYALYIWCRFEFIIKGREWNYQEVLKCRDLLDV